VCSRRERKKGEKEDKDEVGLERYVRSPDGRASHRWVLEGGELVLKRLGKQRMQAEAWAESLHDLAGVLECHGLGAEEVAGHPRHMRS
jgi:hypothetical protein